MQRHLIRIVTWSICFLILQSSANGEEAKLGFESLFNGNDLTGWKGDERFWRVEDGANVGQTTKDNPTKKNTFLVYTGRYCR